jgi:ethanolamine utilization protein EutN
VKIGKIIGNVWADRKVKQLQACRLHVIQPIDSDGNEIERPLVVADPQNLAGSGDRVIYVTSTDASQACDTGFTPLNAAVVELVDFID